MNYIEFVLHYFYFFFPLFLYYSFFSFLFFSIFKFYLSLFIYVYNKHEYKHKHKHEWSVNMTGVSVWVECEYKWIWVWTWVKWSEVEWSDVKWVSMSEHEWAWLCGVPPVTAATMGSTPSILTDAKTSPLRTSSALSANTALSRTAYSWPCWRRNCTGRGGRDELHRGV